MNARIFSCTVYDFVFGSVDRPVGKIICEIVKLLSETYLLLEGDNNGLWCILHTGDIANLSNLIF